MRSAFTLILLAAIVFIPATAYAGPAEVSLEDESYTISVDPMDPWMGVLTIKGDVSVLISGLLETMTVTLSTNITEMGPEGPTGQFWHSIVSFEGGPANTPTHIFRRGDPSKGFTVKLDPAFWDPQQTRDVPVPEGLPMDHWGKLIVTATYSGSNEGSSNTEVRIDPEPFYLLNLSMNTHSHEMRAGDILNYTVVVKNPSNMDAGVKLQIPLLDELVSSGWMVNASIPDLSLLEPGSEAQVRFVLIAPDEIPQDTRGRFEITATTTELDPETLEPEFSTVSGFDLIMVRSSIREDLDPNGNGGSSDGRDGGSFDFLIVAVILVIVAITLIILVALLMSNRGGGDGGSSGEDKTYSAPVRM